MKDSKNYLKLFLIYFGITIPLVYFRFPDVKNEMKYFIITDEMLKGKNLFILKYFNELYPDKPPFYFWILSLIKTIFRENFYFFNIFICSAIAGFIIVLLTYNLVKNLKNENLAFETSISLILFPFFIGIASLQRMDMLMTLFISSALYLFWGFYYEFCKISFKNLFLFYLFIFIGVFTKGVVGIGIPLAIILVFLILEKNLIFLKKLKFFRGFLFIILLFIGWFYIISQSNEGVNYINLLLEQETIGRIVKSKSHIKPFYYYIKVITYAFYPYGFIFLGLAVIYLKKLNFWKNWENLEKIGFISSIIPITILSLASGKLEIYLTPVLQGAVIFTIIGFINTKDNKIIDSIFKFSKILSIFPLILKKDNLKKFYPINISMGILLFIGNFGLYFYNENYSLKPFIKYISSSSGKIISYKYPNFENLSYLVGYKIKDYNNLEDIPKNSQYILNRNKNGELNKNYKFIIKNKKYSLYEKIK